MNEPLSYGLQSFFENHSYFWYQFIDYCFSVENASAEISIVQNNLKICITENSAFTGDGHASIGFHVPFCAISL